MSAPEFVRPPRLLECPKCGSGAITFDAHAGFAVCLHCGADSAHHGPDFFRVGTPIFDQAKSL